MQCRWDSLGMFALQPVKSVTRLYEPVSFRSGKDIQAFGNAQGQQHWKYLGGLEAIDKAYTHVGGGTLTHVGGG